MPQHSDGFIRVRYVLTYENDIDMSSYPGMTPDQAVQHELDNISESEIIELIATCDEEELEVKRSAHHVHP